MSIYRKQLVKNKLLLSVSHASYFSSFQRCWPIYSYCNDGDNDNNEYSKCSKILNTSHPPKRPRQTVQTFFRSGLIRVFPVCLSTCINDIMWIPALITIILFENRKRKLFNIFGHLTHNANSLPTSVVC